MSIGRRVHGKMQATVGNPAVLIAIGVLALGLALLLFTGSYQKASVGGAVHTPALERPWQQVCQDYTCVARAAQSCDRTTAAKYDPARNRVPQQVEVWSFSGWMGNECKITKIVADGQGRTQRDCRFSKHELSVLDNVQALLLERCV